MAARVRSAWSMDCWTICSTSSTESSGLASGPISFCADATPQCRDGNRTAVLIAYTKGGEDFVTKVLARVTMPIDFGLAKSVGDGGGLASLVTREGMVLGTPPYMSPEQARGQDVGRGTDVWAFGCVLSECLTGVRAFLGATLADVLAETTLESLCLRAVEAKVERAEPDAPMYFI